MNFGSPVEILADPSGRAF